MKNLFLIVLAAVVFASCNHESEKPAGAPVPSNEASKLKLSMLSSPKDPVCEMELTDDMIADTAMVDGKVVGFCNAGCKEEFLKKK